MAVNIEDAGFEIRDMIAWVYGSGFPKSLDVGKAIDRRARGEMVRAKLLHFSKVRGVDGKWLESHGVASASSFADWTTGGHAVGEKNWQLIRNALEITPKEEAAFERDVVSQGSDGLGQGQFNSRETTGGYGFKKEYDITAPATDAAKEWQGWGTALKPALEPITVARRPLDGSVADNVQAHQTGAINIDGCRVPFAGADDESESKTKNRHGDFGSGKRENAVFGTDDRARGDSGNYDPPGRWPANLAHDGSAEAVAPFPGAGGGMARDEMTPSGHDAPVKFGYSPERHQFAYGDVGSAARFFYCAKANADERAGGNDHPTVKPINLMRWLCRLVTPAGGVVLDPFAGSGTTVVAAILEGFSAVAIEREESYCEIAAKRIEAAARGLSMADMDSGQGSLF